MAKTFRYQHLHGTTTPSASALKDYELAVKVTKGAENIFLKNSEGEIVNFITEAQVDAKISSESGTTDGKIQALSGAIDTNTSNIETVSGNVNTISGDVATVSGSVATEKSRAEGVESGLRTDVDTVSGSVATEASTRAAKDKAIVDSFVYDSTAKTITLSDGVNTKTIDTTDFVKDGMIDSVEIKNGKLVITWNTDAGKEVTEIPLTDIFDPSNYYTTGQTYTKTEVNSLLADKADTATTYTKTEVDTALAAKANTATTLAGYGITDAYTKTEVDDAIDAEETRAKGVEDEIKQTIEDNERVIASAMNDLNGKINTHTADTNVHVTTSEKSTWNAKQDALVSGTNIKTVQGNSLLGSGNIELGVANLSSNGTADFDVNGNEVILDAGSF